MDAHGTSTLALMWLTGSFWALLALYFIVVQPLVNYFFPYKNTQDENDTEIFETVAEAQRDFA